MNANGEVVQKRNSEGKKILNDARDKIYYHFKDAITLPALKNSG